MYLKTAAESLMQEVLKMNEFNEKQLSPYENLKLNMLLATAADVFDIFSDSMYGEYEVVGNDKNNRKFTVKVVVENEVHK
jgi:hypothetical protein